MGSYQPISRVAIVGAGPSGLAAAKYLLAEKAFATIDIFEQRPNVGGIWNLSGTERTQNIPIPQTDPRYGNFEFRHDISTGADGACEAAGSDDTSLELESPLYDYLETNIPKELMAFSDQPFAAELPLFVGHETTLRYLEHYAQPLRDRIRLNTQVRDIRPASTSTALGTRWTVSVRDLRRGEEETSTYDAVVAANGHYTIPFVPAVPGLAAWHAAHPGAVVHSKAYRRPEAYAGQKVLVVGTSVSGSDIASQIGPYSSKLLLSSRSPPTPGPLPAAPWLHLVPGVSEFLPATRSARFADGQVEAGIDAVIFATGYFYNLPFLSGLSPPPTTAGLRVERLYKHLFYTPQPTLALPVLNLKVIPFPLAENQAAVLARVWAGRLALPPAPEMAAWERATVRAHGAGKDFHLLRFPADAAMVNELYAWAAAAREVEGLEGGGRGKTGKFWDERLVWMRARFPEIKAAYAAQGAGRRAVRTVEELGFDFGAWREEEEKRKKMDGSET